MENTKIIDGVEHVWNIFENAWVTVEYWEWINGYRYPEPDVRTLDLGSK